MMRLLSSLLSLCALLGLSQAADIVKSVTVERIDAALPTQNLRKRSNLPQEVRKGHRRLALFTIPYSLLWRIEIGNGYPEPDREPTDEEYEGVRSVTVDWFDEAHAAYYADSADVTFVSTSCVLVPEETGWEATDDYPHKIQLHCNADFEADALTDLPSNIDFILAINEDYDFEDFTRNYLWNAPPPDNIFQFSQRVGYTLTDNGPSGPAGPVAPTAPIAPVPAPTPPPLAPVPGFSGQYVLPFAINWDMAVGQTTTDRQPTQEEYDGMLAATIQWFTDETNAYYADQASSFTLNQFVANNDPDPTWTPGDQYPHAIPQDCYVIFNANSLDDVPSVLDLLQDVSANYDVTAYIEQYLRNAAPDTSIFREVTLVRYTSSTTTPAGPLTPQAPTAPVASPTMASPTMASPTMASPTMASPTMAAPVAAPTMPVPSPTVAAPAPTRDVGPFPTNPPITAGDGTVVLETVTAWKYAIGFGIPDRQPFLAEYEGYIDSTEAWLTKIYTDAYNNDDSTPEFVSLTSEIQSAEYDSLADPAHTIILRTQYVFELDEGESAPSETELLLVISDANLMDYMLNYLHESQPRFNIFIGTKSVTWAAAAIVPSAPTPTMPGPTMASPTAPAPTAPAPTVPAPTAPAPTAPAPTAPEPTMPAPTNPAPTAPAPTNAAPVAAPVAPTPAPVPAPVPAPTMPQPVENGGAADLSNLDSVRVFMTLSLDINLNRYQGTRMEPTEDEWAGLLLATKKFLTVSFAEYYEGDTESEFVGLQAVVWNTKSYNADQDKPYNGEFRMDVAFMDGAVLLPNSEYWTIINTFDFNNYLQRWVWTEAPSDSIFHYASELSWNFVNSQ